MGSFMRGYWKQLNRKLDPGSRPGTGNLHLLIQGPGPDPGSMRFQSIQLELQRQVLKL
jgi:hypothetical protein